MENEIIFDGLCIACKFWHGDRADAQKKAKEFPRCMDKFTGWAAYGKCGMLYEWADIDVFGDACVKLEVAANFGCIYFSKQQP